MNPINRALHYIEEHLSEDIALEDIAAASNISLFHLSRVFAIATGHPVMEYVRYRRLTEAAKKLEAGAPNLLVVALDYGYGSHGAFTRAFVSRFGVSPNEYRANLQWIQSNFVEPFTWRKTMNPKVMPPRMETGLDLDLLGLSLPLTFATRNEAADLIKRVQSLLGKVNSHDGYELFNVVEPWGFDKFNFFTGATAATVKQPANELFRKEIQRKNQRYAVFTHVGDATELEPFIMAIVGDWLPKSKLRLLDGSHIQQITTPDPNKPTQIKADIWFPITDEERRLEIEPPRIEMGLDLDLVGMSAPSLTFATRHEAGKVVSQLLQRIGEIPNGKGDEIYNVVDNVKEDKFDFFTGVTVSAVAMDSKGLIHKKVKGRKYVVFTHEGDLTEFESFIMAVIGGWLPKSKFKLVDGSHVQRIIKAREAELWLPIH
jgi:AraC family transcriptional regulator